MKYVKIPGTYFEPKLLSKENKSDAINALLVAVMDYGNGNREPEEILEALCEAHEKHLSHAWLIREVAVPAEF